MTKKEQQLLIVKRKLLLAELGLRPCDLGTPGAEPSVDVPQPRQQVLPLVSRAPRAKE
jgi:hypothetical protein